MIPWKQIRAIFLLPGMVTVIIPVTILYRTDIVWPPSSLNVVIGLVFMILGLTLMVLTNRLFTTVGKGTLAPWSPTQKLVVRGVYRHVRNPMIIGVFCILLGEAVFFASWRVLVWFGLFVLINMIYTPLSEEPGLAKRFGEDYLLYKKTVPRWIPRLTAWRGLSE